MTHATKISAVSGRLASAMAATGMPMAYPRSRQNRTVPTVPASAPPGAWSAAAAASTGYIKPVNNPRSTPEAIRFANRASSACSSVSPRVSEDKYAPSYPAPNAARSSEAAPPSKPTLMGQRRPTRSEKIPAASCENPLRNEYDAMNASRRAPPIPSPSLDQLASRPQAMPVSKLAQKPATHTTASARLPQVACAKETERRSARKSRVSLDASKSFSFSALISPDASRSRSASSSASKASSSTNAPVFAAARSLRASRDDRSSRGTRADSSVALSESAAARDGACRDSRSAAAATPTPTAASAS
mmetsp:Transcript_7321/g.31206  ORF Transcript_7321/g.31206 Transcript_7321/m.31206 type:complete len:304 (-) Transcript_7321:670-1581(-)